MAMLSYVLLEAPGGYRLDVDVEQVHHPRFPAASHLDRPMSAVFLVAAQHVAQRQPRAIASGIGIRLCLRTHTRSASL